MATHPPRLSIEPFYNRPLHEFLSRTADKLGDKTAIIDADRRITFSELQEKVVNLASALTSLGIEKGDRVAIFAPNCQEYVISFYAISWTGAVVTTLNPSYREREVEFQLRDSGAKAVILSESLYPVLSPVIPQIPDLQHVIIIGQKVGSSAHSYADLIRGAGRVPPAVDIDPSEDAVALPYSSGTTGLPKGVILTHFNLSSNVQQLLNRPGELAAP